MGENASEFLGETPGKEESFDLVEGGTEDDDEEMKDEPPPLVAGDLVQVEAVEADEELGEDGEAGYEASVQPSSAQNVVLKPLGAGEVMLKRNDWRLGGGGLATRRGAAVVEMQHAIFLQAFADAFGAVLKSTSELDSEKYFVDLDEPQRHQTDARRWRGAPEIDFHTGSACACSCSV